MNIYMFRENKAYWIHPSEYTENSRTRSRTKTTSLRAYVFEAFTLGVVSLFHRVGWQSLLPANPLCAPHVPPQPAAVTARVNKSDLPLRNYTSSSALPSRGIRCAATEQSTQSSALSPVCSSEQGAKQLPKQLMPGACEWGGAQPDNLQFICFVKEKIF